MPTTSHRYTNKPHPYLHRLLEQYDRYTRQATRSGQVLQAQSARLNGLLRQAYLSYSAADTACLPAERKSLKSAIDRSSELHLYGKRMTSSAITQKSITAASISGPLQCLVFQEAVLKSEIRLDALAPARLVVEIYVGALLVLISGNLRLLVTLPAQQQKQTPRQGAGTGMSMGTSTVWPAASRQPSPIHAPAEVSTVLPR